MSLTIGPQVPRRGNAISRWIGRVFLRLIGWRIEGSIPDLPKMVMIGAPHTTNMDGVVSIATLIALGIKASTMIKDSAFKGVMGPILRGFGAIPINRKSPKGVVEQTVDAFTGNAQMVMLIAPEGTRHSAKEWKRGYWHIALGAGVPVLPACVHYGTKIVTFGPPMMPSGNYADDLKILLDFYAQHAGPKHAQRLSKPLCERLGQTWQPEKDD
ncbi:MAG: lysophospholipid acyltransferase family protein [Pseudomonadota bacterium]